MLQCNIRKYHIKVDFAEESIKNCLPTLTFNYNNTSIMQYY